MTSTSTKRSNVSILCIIVHRTQYRVFYYYVINASISNCANSAHTHSIVVMIYTRNEPLVTRFVRFVRCHSPSNPSKLCQPPKKEKKKRKKTTSSNEAIADCRRRNWRRSNGCVCVVTMTKYNNKCASPFHVGINISNICAPKCGR